MADWRWSAIRLTQTDSLENRSQAEPGGGGEGGGGWGARYAALLAHRHTVVFVLLQLGPLSEVTSLHVAPGPVAAMFSNRKSGSVSSVPVSPVSAQTGVFTFQPTPTTLFLRSGLCCLAVLSSQAPFCGGKSLYFYLSDLKIAPLNVFDVSD